MLSVMKKNSAAVLLVICAALACVGPLGCNKPEAKQPEKVEPVDESKPEGGQGEEKPGQNAAGADNPAMEILKKVAKAYRDAKTYSDQGTVRLMIDRPGKPIDDRADFSVVFERPSKLRLKSYQADVVADGAKIDAKIAELSPQYCSRPLKGDLNIQDLFFDPALIQVMSQGAARLSQPLVLLLDKDDPLKVLLYEAEKPVLDKPGEIDGRPCHRIKVRCPDGMMILWIDQADYVLRRVNVPTDTLFKTLQKDGPVTSASITAEFTGAKLNAKIPSGAFVFEMPPKAELVKYFVIPSPAQILGKPAPPVAFTDLDGKRVALADLAGKTVVIEYWSAVVKPCVKSLQILAKAAEKYADDKNVVFLAASVDAPSVDNAELAKTMEKIDVHLPVVRDSDNTMLREFRTDQIPSLFLIDPKGVLQYFEIIGNPDLAAPLPEKIDAVLAGKDIFEEPLERYAKARAQYEADMDKLTSGQTAEGGATQEQEIPRTDIAEKSEPRTLKLKPLWNCHELKSPDNIPGNILILPGDGQNDRILVIEAFKGIAELGPDGKIAGDKKFKLADNEVVSALRTAVDGKGNRYFAAFAVSQQRFHFFDKDWNQLFSFPEDALENKHDGIADVELGDLNGDGVPEAYVGYWGLVGVQAVSLDGKRTASNRRISDVVRCAISAPDKDGARGLFCVNRRKNLAVLDGQLQQITELTVPNRPLTWVVSAPLSGDPNLDWCTLCSARLGENIALGIDLDGRELWNYPLPEGWHPQPIEPIIPGSLDGKKGVWLLAGTDGSIHIVAPDGTAIDRFHYGKQLCGLATAKINGRQVLLVASPDGVEALEIE